MGLGGKMDDGVDGVFLEYIFYGIVIAYIGMLEKVARTAEIFCDIRQVVGIAGVSELVDVDDAPFEAAVEQEITDEVGADKPGAAGYEDIF